MTVLLRLAVPHYTTQYNLFVESAANMGPGVPAQPTTQRAGSSNNALDIVDEMTKNKGKFFACNFRKPLILNHLWLYVTQFLNLTLM